MNPQSFESEVEDALLECRQIARAGALLIAEERLKCLLEKVTQGELRARILNDLGVISAACGRDEEAQELLTNALLLNRNWRAPAESLRRLSEQRVVPPGPRSGGRNRRVAIAERGHAQNSKSGGKEGGRIIRKLLSELIETRIQQEAIEQDTKYRTCHTIHVTCHDSAAGQHDGDINSPTEHFRVAFE